MTARWKSHDNIQRSFQLWVHRSKSVCPNAPESETASVGKKDARLPWGPEGGNRERRRWGGCQMKCEGPNTCASVSRFLNFQIYFANIYFTWKTLSLWLDFAGGFLHCQIYFLFLDWLVRLWYVTVCSKMCSIQYWMCSLHRSFCNRISNSALTTFRKQLVIRHGLIHGLMQLVIIHGLIHGSIGPWSINIQLSWWDHSTCVHTSYLSFFYTHTENLSRKFHTQKSVNLREKRPRNKTA